MQKTKNKKQKLKFNKIIITPNPHKNRLIILRNSEIKNQA